MSTGDFPCPHCGGYHTASSGWCPIKMTTFPYTPNYSQGWVCPKCGNVYSPTHWECSRCNAVTVPEVPHE
jgi:hypothetical protein